MQKVEFVLKYQMGINNRVSHKPRVAARFPSYALAVNAMQTRRAAFMSHVGVDSKRYVLFWVLDKQGNILASIDRRGTVKKLG